MNSISKFMVLSAIMMAIAAPSFAAPVQTTAPAPSNTVVQKIPQKIGVVDVKKVVAGSKEVQKVKKDRDADMKILKSFIENSAAQLNKEKDPKKNEALKEKLNKELNAKKDVMDKDYQAKLLKINNDMNSQLTNMAKAKKYDLILTQDSVLYGGDNLTKDLMKLVK